MNYPESINYLYSLGHETLAMKLGLESVRALCRALGEPQFKYPVVHIAGTNGKGSTSAMVEAMARAAGLKTGLYTSPHLVAINERMRVGGVDISDDDFARLATRVRAAGEQLVGGGTLPAPPTYFEQVTAIAFLYFAEQAVDLTILEVGLGGRLDATNVCAPLVTAITPVSFDHMEYLGHTLAAIAGEKAGIIKPGVPVAVAPQEPEAMTVIAAKAAEMNAPLVAVESPAHRLLDCRPIESRARSPLDAGRFHFRYRTPAAEYEVVLNLRGAHQVSNARTAIHVAEELTARGVRLPRAAVEAGLRRVVWPGRLEVAEVEDARRGLTLPVLLDGAHNAAGAEYLRDYLAQFQAGRPVTLVFGVLADKKLDEMARLLVPLAETVVATRIASPRTSEPQAIAAQAEAMGRRAVAVESAGLALDAAVAATPPGGLICVCGSLYLIGEVKRLLAARRSAPAGL
jgi:dihydrofolate synthase / folylpolyglutamate synthase